MQSATDFARQLVEVVRNTGAAQLPEVCVVGRSELPTIRTDRQEGCERFAYAWLWTPEEGPSLVPGWSVPHEVVAPESRTVETHGDPWEKIVSAQDVPTVLVVRQVYLMDDGRTDDRNWFVVPDRDASIQVATEAVELLKQVERSR